MDEWITLRTQRKAQRSYASQKLFKQKYNQTYSERIHELNCKFVYFLDAQALLLFNRINNFSIIAAHALTDAQHTLALG